MDNAIGETFEKTTLEKGIQRHCNLGRAERFRVCLLHLETGAVTTCQLITIIINKNKRHFHKAVTVLKGSSYTVSHFFSLQQYFEINIVNTPLLQRCYEGSEN